MPLLEMNTPRLLLRRFTIDDLDDFSLVCSDPEVMKYLEDGNPLSKEEILFHLEIYIRNSLRPHGFGRWAVINKEKDEFLGFCGLTLHHNLPELVFLLKKEYWGKGLASEASAAALWYGFELLQIDFIVAITRPENFAARRVLERIGMKYDRDEVFSGIYCAVYSLAKEDYSAASPGTFSIVNKPEGEDASTEFADPLSIPAINYEAASNSMLLSDF